MGRAERDRPQGEKGMTEAQQVANRRTASQLEAIGAKLARESFRDAVRPAKKSFLQEIRLSLRGGSLLTRARMEK